MTHPVSVGIGALSIEDVVAVARHGAEVTIDPVALDEIASTRERVEGLAADPTPVSSVSTGFGVLATKGLRHRPVRAVPAGNTGIRQRVGGAVLHRWSGLHLPGVLLLLYDPGGARHGHPAENQPRGDHLVPARGAVHHPDGADRVPDLLAPGASTPEEATQILPQFRTCAACPGG